MSTEDKHFIDHIFQSKMGSAASAPSDDIWNRIEASLDAQKPKAHFVPFYSKTVLFGVAVGLGLMCLNFVFNHKINAIENGQISIQSNIEKSNITSNLNSQSIELNKPTVSVSTETVSSSTSSNISSNNSNINSQHIIPNYIAPSSNGLKISSQHFIPRSSDKMKKVASSKELYFNEATDKYYVSRDKEMVMLQVVGYDPISMTAKSESVNSENISPEIEFKKLNKAQYYHKGFYGGVNGGVNTSSLFYTNRSKDFIFNDKTTIKPAMGLTYGLTFGYDINKKIAIQSGFNFTRYNFDVTQPIDDYILNGELNVFQFDIPVLFKYKWSIPLPKKNNAMFLSALAGIQFSILQQYNMQAYLQSTQVNSIAKIELDHTSYNRYQMGYVLGMEFSYPLSRKWSLNANAFGGVSSDISQFPIFLNNQLEKPMQLMGTGTVGLRYHFKPVRKR
jgi:hypothetical protein